MILKILTITLCLAIFFTWAWAHYYVSSASTIDLKNNKKWIGQLPSILSTLGVLGTFTGITIGLIGFDPKHIDTSITELLDGLKMAFFTSLVGMICSLILSRLVSRRYDELVDNDLSKDATAIIAAITELKKNNDKNIRELILANEKSHENTVQALHSGSLKEYVEQLADDIESTKESIQTIQNILADNNENNVNQQLTELSRISAELLTASIVITKVGNDMDEIKEVLEVIKKKD